MQFTVYGQPQGKARARTFYDKRSRSMRSVTPEKTTSYEDLVRWSYKAAGGEYLGEDPIEVEIIAGYEIPKSWSMKKKQEALDDHIRPTVKPDLDNIAKAILDALNGVAFKDDNQVVRLIVSKYYSKEAAVRVFINKV